MAKSWDGQEQFQSARVQAVPIHALSLSTRRLCGVNLDPDRHTLSQESGYQQDWVGMGELMGYRFSYQELKEYSNKTDRTLQLLQRWSANPDATVGKFLAFLESLERLDLLENRMFQHKVLQDVNIYHDLPKKEGPQLQENHFRVSVADAYSAQRLKLQEKADTIVKVIENHVTFLDTDTRTVLLELPNKFIRGVGHNQTRFTVEVGRRSPGGEGVLVLLTKEGLQIHNAFTYNVRREEKEAEDSSHYERIPAGSRDTTASSSEDPYEQLHLYGNNRF